MRIRALDARTIRKLASYEELIPLMSRTLTAVSRGDAALPLRTGMPLPGGGGVLVMMPGFLGSDSSAGSQSSAGSGGSEANAGVKLLSLAPKQAGRSSHLGVMMLYDANLLPMAMLCGSTVTALRTAATTACATDVLAPKSARQLAILGSGEQAESHLSALQLVRNFESIRIWSRTRANALALADRHAQTGSNIEVCDSVETAVNEADVICTLTRSPTPILAGRLVANGVHVNLVGSSSRGSAETDDELVARARFFVDFKTSALNQAGELLGAIERGRITEQHIAAEIGAVIAGTHPGRTSPSDLTVFKSLGIAAEDIALAAHIHRKAERLGLGQMVEL